MQRYLSVGGVSQLFLEAYARQGPGTFYDVLQLINEDRQSMK